MNLNTNILDAVAGSRKSGRASGASWLVLLFALALAPISGYSQQQQAAPAKDEAGQRSAVTLQTGSAAKAALPVIDAKAAAALVSEFDVNGMKVLVKRRPGSQTVAAGLFIRGGSRNVTAKNAGIESLMLSVATEASQKYPRQRMRDELSSMGTAIGSGANNDYSALTLGSTRVNFEKSWDIFVDVALNPSFTKQDVDLVKSRTVTGLQGINDDPDSFLQQLVEHTAYAGHPYLNDPRGSIETVGRLTAEDLRAYHQKLMQTSRLLLVIVGDLDVDQVRPRVVAAFGKATRGDYKPAPMPLLEFGAPTVEVTQRALPTNYVRGLFTAPSLSSSDFYPMRVASAILNNRVLVEVRFRRNLSYAPEAFLDTEEANTGGLYVTAVDANQAVRVMLDEVTRLKREPISQTDITATVAEFLTKYYMSQETNAAQAGELAKYELLGAGWRNAFDFIDRLGSVSPADVQRVSQKYMKNMRFVVVGNPEAVDKSVFTAQATE
jgi:zinc protease